MTVYGVLAKLDAEGKVQRSCHTPRNDRKLLKTFWAGLKKSIKADQPQSMSKTSQKNAELATEPSAEQSLKTLGWAITFGDAATSSLTHSRAIRFERCPKLLNHLKNKGRHVRSFVDEKKFIVDKVTNRQNMWVIACDPSDVILWCRVRILLLWWFCSCGKEGCYLLISSKLDLKSTWQSI